MDRNGIRDDVAPWSFFLPVTLAVVVGGLLVGLVLRTIDLVFAPSPARTPVEAVQPPAPASPEASPKDPAAAVAMASTSAEQAGDALAQETQQTQDTAAEAEAPAAGVPVLPGPIVARRDGAAEACINGSIALRAENGWEQRLENDAPVPCVEVSAAAR